MQNARIALDTLDLLKRTKHREGSGASEEGSVLADDDAISVGVDVDPTALALTEYLLLSNRTKYVLDTAPGRAWNPSKRPR
jgi:hypothetical protein